MAVHPQTRDLAQAQLSLEKTDGLVVEQIFDLASIELGFMAAKAGFVDLPRAPLCEIDSLTSYLV
jgi:hypothetical protein